MARILVADDEEGLLSFMQEVLELAGHEVRAVPDGDRAAAALDRESFDLLVTDLRMPGRSGLDLVKKVRAEQPDVEVLVLTAFGSVDTAVEAMKLGAFDYVQKPLPSPASLRLLVDRALERRSLLAARERAGLDGGAGAGDDGPALTWGDPAMAPVVASLRKVARTRATVLLTGESGVGKEVAARALHTWSPRAKGPFVAVSCAVLGESLLESELFGHEKGAFTGAHARKRGRIELAAGGTFFLDEVGELPIGLQAKLLRVLEERTFERVGGVRSLRADVRWIAATNHDLEAQIAAGRFREDLFHRLAVFPVHLPPLRERPADILPLARRLLVGIARELGTPALKLGPGAEAALTSGTWRGNARALRNALERAAILADGVTLSATVLADAAAAGRAPARADAPRAGGAGPATVGETPAGASDGSAAEGPVTLQDLERDAIVQALAAVDGNRRRAAERLGIGVRTLYDKLKRYGIG